MDFLKGDPHAIAESLESALVWWKRSKSIHPHDDDFEIVVERMPDIDDVRHELVRLQMSLADLDAAERLEMEARHAALERGFGLVDKDGSARASSPGHTVLIVVGLLAALALVGWALGRGGRPSSPPESQGRPEEKEIKSAKADPPDEVRRADEAEFEAKRKAEAKREALQTAQATFNSLEGEMAAVWGEGDRAVGNDAVGALGNMFGDKVGEAQGFGGLGVAGTGRGGGGLGASSVGVGNVGTVGRRGGGKSGYGRGASRLGERTSNVPKVIPGKPLITGALDTETVRLVTRRHRNEYKYCYEKQLNVQPDLSGKIVVQFTISGNGSVIAASVEESTMNDSGVENCLVGKIRRWVFPAPKGGGIVVVKYPFIFRPS